MGTVVGAALYDDWGRTLCRRAEYKKDAEIDARVQWMGVFSECELVESDSYAQDVCG